MVAKKTAAKKSSATGPTGAAEGAKDVAGKKSAVAKKPAAGRKKATKAVGKKATQTAGEPAGKAAGGASGDGDGDTRKTGAEAPAGTSTAKRTTAKRTTAKKPTAKAAAAKKAPAAKKQTGARSVAAKKTAGGVTTVEDEAAAPAGADELAVRPGEEPWTPEEVAEARNELQAEVLRLRSELAHSEEELTGLMWDSGDGAGDDQADTGTKNITREHELALAANAREMLEQTEHALERLDAGTYGLCEVCGKPIGKARMQAFPRATLCVQDKQRQERRG
ncbi:TraR/DksA family transcriptional regulator [Streptomyces sp. NPDC058872]|uniref:TraR/DksA family transcriptional regulator n=1 Tax=Streptomyces sp. NPDC058872 TaxID=3346661 RepID=UPI0036D1542C